MTKPLTKQDIVKAMEELPDDATVEDAMERLYLAYRINQGLEQIRRGEGVSHEEATARFEKWLKWP